MRVLILPLAQSKRNSFFYLFISFSSPVWLVEYHLSVRWMPLSSSGTPFLNSFGVNLVFDWLNRPILYLPKTIKCMRTAVQHIKHINEHIFGKNDAKQKTHALKAVSSLVGHCHTAVPNTSDDICFSYPIKIIEIRCEHISESNIHFDMWSIPVSRSIRKAESKRGRERGGWGSEKRSKNWRNFLINYCGSQKSLNSFHVNKNSRKRIDANKWSCDSVGTFLQSDANCENCGKLRRVERREWRNA